MRSHFVEEDLPTLMAGPEKRDPPSVLQATATRGAEWSTLARV